MATRAELVVKYNEMRDAYLKAGNLLEEAVKLFMSIMEKVSDIEDLFKNNGWGYK